MREWRHRLVLAEAWAIRFALWFVFERLLRIRTEDLREDIWLGDADRLAYIPSQWLTLPRALRRSELTADDVLVDFGCGKGRIVVEAALLYRLKRVVGVELSPELVQIARGNLARNRLLLRTRDVEIVESDVLAYPIPDDVTVAYFFHPFQGPIFSHVIDELIATVDRSPRRLRIIYCNPVLEATILETGRIRRVGSGHSLRSRVSLDEWLAIYEVEPAPISEKNAG